METDIRHMIYQISLEEKLEHERLEQQRAKHFRAQPLPHDEPFVPKRSDRPLTEVDDVVLFTEMRSEERRAFEEMLKQKEEMEQRERERMKREQEVCASLQISPFCRPWGMHGAILNATSTGTRKGRNPTFATTASAPRTTRQAICPRCRQT